MHLSLSLSVYIYIYIYIYIYRFPETMNLDVCPLKSQCRHGRPRVRASYHALFVVQVPLISSRQFVCCFLRNLNYHVIYGTNCLFTVVL